MNPFNKGKDRLLSRGLFDIAYEAQNVPISRKKCKCEDRQTERRTESHVEEFCP